MAKSPELVAATASALDMEPVTVGIHMRRLREAGLVLAQGRGPHAKAMTSDDAERLLLASCLARPNEIDSVVEGVKDYEPLQCVSVLMLGDPLGNDPSELPLARLPEQHRLGTALRTLIEAASTGKLFPFKDYVRNEDRSRTYEAETSYASGDTRGFVSVRFHAPLPAAMIQHQIGGLYRTTWTYGLPLGDDLGSYRRDIIDRGGGWRIMTTEIGDECLTMIGKCLAE